MAVGRDIERRLRALGAASQIDGEPLAFASHGSGHINDTYLSIYRHRGAAVRYVHQRVNRRVFRDPVGLMDNVARVTRHLRDRLLRAGEPDLLRRCLTLVPTVDGTPWFEDEDGEVWRTYLFIEGARTYDVIESERHAYQGGRAFGEFQRLLADLPGPRLVETIPAFHDTPARLAQLQEAVERDVVGRARAAQPEIDAAMARAGSLGWLEAAKRDGRIPERVTHNDTKLNNVMIDDDTGAGLCVIDLDTTMPGAVAYDFGDLVRTGVSPAAEDERRLDRARVRLEVFEALCRGYAAGAGSLLTGAEVDSLAPAARLITLETAMRFLADHLVGDIYFKVHRPDHNLDRCRAQLALVRRLERHEDELRRIVSAAFSS